MIEVNHERCTGCRRCETACSFAHFGHTGVHARISVLHHHQNGLDVPVLCRQCQEQYCLDCPSNAITIGRMGEIVASPTLCTGCGKCQRDCPIGAIRLENNKILVCDLCGGQPRCVEACTEKALTFSFANQATVSLSHMPRKVGDTVTEKQKNYIESLSAAEEKG